MEVDTVINGDCLEVMRGMEDDSVDLVLTDPPYKISQKYGGGVDADNLIAVSGIFRTLPEMSRILKPNRFAVICYDNRILPFLFEATKDTDLVYRKQLYIYRRWGTAHRWIGWMQTTDPVCIFVNGYDKPFAPKDVKWKVKHDCYLKDTPEEESTGHPAQKPLNFMQDVIAWLSEKNNIVFDPYAGSGTVLRAAVSLDRHFIGIEINADYCKTAENRIQDEKERYSLFLGKNE